MEQVLSIMRRGLYKILLRKRISAVTQTGAEVVYYSSRQVKERYQVKKFNEVWQIARQNVPFYGKWQKRFGLPDRISGLKELKDWPILTKSDLRNLEDFQRTDVPYPKDVILTGGSTGEPVRLPKKFDPTVGPSQLMGRARYGVEVGDRTFLLWGHEHLYGTGFKRKINILKRRLKDWLADWMRVSAYDLGTSAMTAAFKKFQAFRPKFVYGFSPAVLAFCRINRAHRREVDSVKVVLCSSGPLTDAEKAEIEDFFGAKVCMEYGSVECGIMAYTRPEDGEYDVFWNTHLLQAKKENGEYRNIVTRLTDCYVPLIRYDIGDYLDLDPAQEADNERSVLEIRSVKGRPSEMLQFKCGVSFFGALIGDCVKQVVKVIQSQIVVDQERDALSISVVTNGEQLREEDKDLIIGRIKLTVNDASKLNLSVVQVDKLWTTVGGKTPRIVQRKLEKS